MSGTSIFKITEVVDGVIVTEFDRGEQKSISIDDYVAQGNNIQDLFVEYFNNNPDKTSNLVFGDTDDPAQGSISYKNAIIDHFDKKELQSLINGSDEFLGVVSYKDILVNTQNLMPEEAEEPDTSMSETISGVTEDLKKSGLRGFINKHKILTGVILIVVLTVSLLIGISLTKAKPPPEREIGADVITKYLAEKKQFLGNLVKQNSKDAQSAKIQIHMYIDELNKIKDKEMSGENKATLQELLRVAEKYRASIPDK